MAIRTPARRRQRSVRVTVAVALLSVATAAVLVSLPTQSPLFLSIGSVVALLLSWAGLRIMWTEVLESRREAAFEKTNTAHLYRSLFSERAAEHAEFTTAMTERLAESNLSRHELEAALVLSEKRATESAVLAQRESKRAIAFQTNAVELEEKVADLERALVIRQAEEADALASWEAEGGDPIVELVGWDEKAAENMLEKSGKVGRNLKGA